MHGCPMESSTASNASHVTFTVTDIIRPPFLDRVCARVVTSRYDRIARLVRYNIISTPVSDEKQERVWNSKVKSPTGDAKVKIVDCRL